MFFIFCIIDFRVYVPFYYLCIFLLGRYDKFDSIVSPSTETWNVLKQFYRYVTRSIADKSDTEEFTLCLRAYLPKYTLCSWCMEDVIESYLTVVQRLCDMSFTVSGSFYWRFLDFSSYEKQKVNQRNQLFKFYFVIFKKSN